MIINFALCKPIADLNSRSLIILCAALAVNIFSASSSSSFILAAFGQIDLEKKQPRIISCNCVAFRLDDIQDYFLTNPQMAVINTFEQKNANVTVGVIGNSFGHDLFMVLFLKEKITSYDDGNNSFAIEVANHGWNHEDFTRFNKEEQSALMQQTNEKILNILGVTPTVFIPPYNVLNNYTIAALLENNIHYVSANATSYSPSILYGYQNESGSNAMGQAFTKTNTILHFPSSAATGDLNADNTEWLGYSHNTTFAAINASVNELGYAVVTMHPMEFSLRNRTTYQNEVDNGQIRELELLIDDVRARGLKIVTISEIDQDNIASIPEFSSYSIYAILAISIVLVIWSSTKSKRDISRHHGSRINNASL